jgi:hypothetical protein
MGVSAPAFAPVEEIIVIAHKVEENVQDMPIATTAVSDESHVLLNTGNRERLHVAHDADRYSGASIRFNFSGVNR